MKILQIFNRYTAFGGEEASVKTIAAALMATHEIRNLYGSTEAMLGTSFFSKLSAPFKAVWNWETFDKVLQLQDRENFDLWMIHNVFPGLSPSIYDAARERDVPVLQYLHNYRFGCVNGFFLNHGEPCTRCLHGNFLPAIQTRCWRESRIACAAMGISLTRLRAVGVHQQISRWVAISHAQKRIHVQLGIPERKISVLHHFYDDGIARSPTPGRDVLFVGRLSAEKGVALLIEAWKKAGIAERNLVIVGEGPTRPALEKAAKGIPNIRFAGFLRGEQLKKAWLDAAVSVVPSVWEEPFGRVVLESWAHGIPVLAADIGALPELIHEGGAGWLFDASSSESLAAHLRHILLDNPTALETARGACHDAVAKFSKQSWLASIHAILESAAGTTGSIPGKAGD